MSDKDTIRQLNKKIRELEEIIEKQRIDLLQMRSVYDGNVQLQDINIDLENKIERLKRKIKRLKGEEDDNRNDIGANSICLNSNGNNRL